MKMKSASQSQGRFATIPSVSQPRSVFNRTRTHKTTFDEGLLYPVLVDEMLPGDTIQCNMSNFVRMPSPMKEAVMDNMYLDSQFFFCPNRLLFTLWPKLMGEQDNPADTIDYMTPVVSIAGGATTGSELLADYMGIPTHAEDLVVSAMPFRMYNRVYHDWYRDQNLVDAPVLNVGLGPDTESDTVLRRRGKRKDYFTGALPFEQKGDPVTLALGTSAPIVSTGSGIPTFRTLGETDTYNLQTTISTDAIFSATPDASSDPVTWLAPALEVDLLSATGATVNALRESLAIQTLLERDARAGTRYVEKLQAEWGVTSPDFRLQRSEYLGGGTQRINFSPVAATSEAQSVDLGQLGAYATSAGSGHSFNYSATEHGWIMCLISVRADYTYQSGLNRMWSRRERYDFYTPDLAHLGEQKIKNKEIFADSSAADELTWGFQERWAEYRYGESLITGKFRSNAPGSLDVYHVAEDFTSIPVLGQAFIEESPPVTRIVQVPTEPHFIGDFYFAMRHARVMPTYSVPGLLNRL